MNAIQVACGIICREGKVLAARRSEQMAQSLKWEFPGGKLKGGETAEDCLHRELAEELNISVLIKSRLKDSVHDYGNFMICLIPFLVEYVKGEIVLLEHCEYGWFSTEELAALDWAPADIPIVHELITIL